jgi:hypothetical protein
VETVALNALFGWQRRKKTLTVAEGHVGRGGGNKKKQKKEEMKGHFG